MQYHIDRNGSSIATIKPNGTQTKKIMDVNILSITFSLPYYQEFLINDTITFDGETYKLLTAPNFKKNSTVDWSYELEFKGRAYDLIKAAFLGPDGNNNLTEGRFSVMGNADVIIDHIVLNANRFDSGWQKGTVDATEAVNFPFDGDNCLSVLSTLADQYKLEWWVENQTIHLTKRGVVEAVTFEYGRGKGLYNIERNTQTDKAVCTRLYVYGSDQNIPSTYRGYSSNLKLPAGTLYLEKNVAKYGIIERVQTFDDIKPQYIGTITSVSSPLIFQDSAINFDIDAQRIPNVNPKICFLTGQMAGYNCEEASFNNTTKTIRILQNQDEKAFQVPSELLKPAIGDTYTIVDINMPQVYIDDAENRLLVAGQKYLDENSDPIVVYTVTPDPINFKQRNISLTIGNYVRVKDTDIGLDKDIRITSITRDIQNKYHYTSVDMQEVISVPQVVRNYNAYAGIKSAVALNKLSDVARSRMNWRTTQELRSKIYDPDTNYFDMNNIMPGSIETLMLSVGSKSQQFALRGVTFSPNYEGDPTKFANSAGQLVHFTIANNPITWDVSNGLFIGLDVTKAYYIYVKCNISDFTGSIVLSETIITTTAISGYYVFLAGVLHSVIDNVRGISLTYGQTNINGRFITTGRIESNDGLTYFDLDNGVIGGAIEFGNGGTSTIVDGRLVTSGTIELGDTTGQHAGITGDVVDGDSVLIWAGSDYAHRDSAPFRVTANGQAFISMSGKIGNFTIDQYGLTNTDGSDAYIQQIRTYSDGKKASMKIGLHDFGNGNGTQLAEFINDKVGDIENVAIYVRCTGAIQANNAIICEGNINVMGGGSIKVIDGHLDLLALDYQGDKTDYQPLWVNLHNGRVVRG